MGIKISLLGIKMFRIYIPTFYVSSRYILFLRMKEIFTDYI